MAMGYSAVAFAAGEEEWGRQRLESERSTLGSFESLRGDRDRVRRPEVAVVKGRVAVVDVERGLARTSVDVEPGGAVAKMPTNVMLGKKDTKDGKREVKRPDTPIVREEEVLQESGRKKGVVGDMSRETWWRGETIVGESGRIDGAAITGKRIQ